MLSLRVVGTGVRVETLGGDDPGGGVKGTSRDVGGKGGLTSSRDLLLSEFCMCVDARSWGSNGQSAKQLVCHKPRYS